jgi:hypothetical protein
LNGASSWRGFRSGGHTPPDPMPGGSTPWTPFSPPPWAEGLPAYWVPLVAGSLMWATRPFFFYFGGTSPKPPARGRGLRPLATPFFFYFFPPSPSLAEGSPAFWVLTSPPAENPAKFSPFPRREGGQGVRSERHIPQTPRQGARPLDPHFSHPRGLRVCQRYGSHSWRGGKGWLPAPYFGFVGGHSPQRWLFAPKTHFVIYLTKPKTEKGGLQCL